MTALWSELSPELQELAKPAREAVRRGESVLLKGPPGAGKLAVARRLHASMPPLQQAREVNAIYRMAGLKPLTVLQRPFRAPHYTCSALNLSGSNQDFRPGELSLAHCGVLLLDDVAEFQRQTLSMIARVHCDRKVMFPTPDHLISLPADFVLVATVCLCPCGPHQAACKCGGAEIERYHMRYDALDFDVTVDLPARV